MSLAVTLHVFSGRPNPVWVIPDEAEAEFDDRLARIAVTARISNLKSGGVLGGLGYRGFTVRDESATRSIHVDSGVVDIGQRSPTFLTADRELESWLLSTGKDTVEEGVREHVERQLEKASSQGAVIQYQPIFECPLCVAKDAPVRDLPLWSWTDCSSADNNCYNYATNRMTNTTAQPGKAAGQKFTQLNTCTGAGSVLAGATADGLVACANFTDPLPAGQGWYVALVLWPGHDFHWYRQDNGGCWSQKMGGDDASSVDNSRKTIRDPKTADRGPYTTFCTYMVTKCCLQVR